MPSDLGYDLSLLSPGTDEIHSPDSLSQQENILPTSVIGDQDKVQMLVDEVLFLEFLLSPSSLLCHIGADHGKDDLRTSIPPQTIVPADVYLSPKKDPYLTDQATERVLDVIYKNIQTKRPL